MFKSAIHIDKNVDMRRDFSCLLKAMLRLSIICMARDVDNKPISILMNHIMHSSSISSLHFHSSKKIGSLEKLRNMPSYTIFLIKADFFAHFPPYN